MPRTLLRVLPTLGVAPALHLLWVGLALGRRGSEVRADVEMYAGKTAHTSTADLTLRADAPSALRGWEIRRGTCERPGATFGSTDAYPALRVNREGKAAGKAAIDLAVPDSGDFHVVVTASPTDRQRVLACGNLVLED